MNELLTAKEMNKYTKDSFKKHDIETMSTIMDCIKRNAGDRMFSAIFYRNRYDIKEDHIKILLALGYTVEENYQFVRVSWDKLITADMINGEIISEQDLD